MWTFRDIGLHEPEIKTRRDKTMTFEDRIKILRIIVAGINTRSRKTA
jgi:hypothetical protein